MVPDNQDQPIEYGKQTEPEQEFLPMPPPNGIDGNSSCAERDDYSADNQECDSSAHK